MTTLESIVHKMKRKCKDFDFSMTSVVHRLRSELSTGYNFQNNGTFRPISLR
jgi:hypothetical protein